MAGAEGIEYIIDSATFKHGRHTPVYHVPIVPPEKIHSHPVDVVLITNVYEAEIECELKEKHAFTGWILSLRERTIEILQNGPTQLARET